MRPRAWALRLQTVTSDCEQRRSQNADAAQGVRREAQARSQCHRNRAGGSLKRKALEPRLRRQDCSSVATTAELSGVGPDDREELRAADREALMREPQDPEILGLFAGSWRLTPAENLPVAWL